MANSTELLLNDKAWGISYLLKKGRFGFLGTADNSLEQYNEIYTYSLPDKVLAGYGKQRILRQTTEFQSQETISLVNLPGERIRESVRIVRDPRGNDIRVGSGYYLLDPVTHFSDKKDIPTIIEVRQYPLPWREISFSEASDLLKDYDIKIAKNPLKANILLKEKKCLRKP